MTQFNFSRRLLPLIALLFLSFSSVLAASVDYTSNPLVVTFGSSTLPTNWSKSSGATFNSSYFKITSNGYFETSNITALIPEGEMLNSNLRVDVSCGTFGTWTGTAKSVKVTVSLYDASGNVLSSGNKTYSSLSSSETTYRGEITVSKPSNPSAIKKVRIEFSDFNGGTTARFKNAKFFFSTTPATDGGEEGGEEGGGEEGGGDEEPGSGSGDSGSGAYVYERVSQQSDIVEGGKYLIVCESDNSAMGSQSDNRRNPASVTITNHTIALDAINTDNAPFEVTLGKNNEKWTMVLSNGKYLGNGSSSSNNLKEVATMAAGYCWTLTYSNGTVAMTTDHSTPRKLCVNTANSDSYATYTSISSYKAVTLYKLQTTAPSGDEDALTTMDEIFAKAQEVDGTETAVRVTLDNWVISGVNGSNAYLTDGTKGLIIYKSGHGFVAGDILSGTVSTKIKLFNNSAEFTTLTSTTDGLSITRGGTVTEQNIAIASLSGVNTGALLAYENLSYHLNGTSAEFSDGENVIVAYKGIMDALPELVEGKTYDIKGIFLMYGEKKEILPRSAEDIVLKENINTYTISYAATENGTIVVKNGDTPLAEGAEVAEGTTLTIECTPVNADYRFKNWQYKAGEGSWTAKYSATQNYTMPSANVQFKANFELIPTYTINWYVAGTAVQTDNLKDGAAVTAPADPAVDGKTFVGWAAEANKNYYHATEEPESVTPQTTASASANYYAVFATQEGAGGAAVTEELTNAEVQSLSSSAKLEYATEKTYTDGTVDYSIYANTDAANRKWMQLKKDQGVYVKITAPDAIKTVVLTLTSTTNSKGGIADIAKHDPFTGTVALTAVDCSYTTSSASVASTDVITNNVATLTPTGSNTELYLKVSTGARIWSISVTYGGGATYSDYTTLSFFSDVTTGNYGTICLPYAVAADARTGAQFFNIVSKNATETGIIIEEETGVLTAGKPYIYYAENEGTMVCNYSETPTSEVVAANGLVGYLEATPNVTVDGNTYFIKSNKLYHYAGTTTTVTAPANKAFISWSAVPAYVAPEPNEAPRRVIYMENVTDQATGLDELNADSIQKFFQNGQVYIFREGRLYDVTGRLVK